MASRRKLENAALALSVFGAVLIVPPILSIFNVQLRLFGVPVVVIYLFLVWITLVGVTRFLSGRMPEVEISDEPTEREGDV